MFSERGAVTKIDRSVRLIPERHVTRQLTEQVGSRDRDSFIPMFSKLPVFLLLQFPDGVLCERGVGMVCGCAAVKRSSDHAPLRSVSSDPDSPSCVVPASLGQFVFNLLFKCF